jgi:precorrin-2 dehydrogenase / sirohydrochlorin ferrochelatase
MPGYPIELDLRGKTAVVVGLGAVGRRKTAGLVEAGARVIGIEPALLEMSELEIEIVAEPYRGEHLAGASLAFAAATAEVNRRVVADAGSTRRASRRPATSPFRRPGGTARSP